jgi:AraC-type DNA-binding domain-containing proteins
LKYAQTLQTALNYIDENITIEMSVAEIAEKSGYSAYHFSRIFTETFGISLISYVTRRKLQYALYDLSQGKKVIDAAMDYGFETHAGFTKAFVRCFGFPPSLCRLHITADSPEKATIAGVKLRYGGINMTPYITVMTPFAVAGRTIRQKLPDVKHHADIPAYCFGVNSSEAEIIELCPTQDDFPKSDAIKHCEISMCYDVDATSGEFTYLLGRGIFHPDDLKNITADMVSFEINGLYAIFSTSPVVSFDKHDKFAQIIQNTWNDIFTNWLPNSEFEYDETRKDFEYYDYRDHGWYFDNKRQMDIYIPIRQREEARRKSQEKGKILWEKEMKRRAQR